MSPTSSKTQIHIYVDVSAPHHTEVEHGHVAVELARETSRAGAADGEGEPSLAYRLTIHSRELGTVEIGELHAMTIGPDLSLRIEKGVYRRLSAVTGTLGQSFTYYESLSNLGDALARDILSSLRDVVISPSRRRRFVHHPNFDRRLVADGRARRALEDAPRLFEGPKSAVETARRSRVSRHWSLPLSTAGGATELRFNFTPIGMDVPYRMVALIGANGTGKSAMLGAIANVVLERNVQHASFHISKIRSLDRQSVDIARVVSISYGAFDQNSLPNDATQADNGSERETESKRVRYLYRGLRTWASDSSEYRLKSLGEIEAEFWNSYGLIDSSARRVAFADALERVREASQFPENVLSHLRSGHRGPISLRELSSGQTVALNIIVSLIAHLEPGSLVLIDEPEVHLHPPLVSALIRSIAACLETFDALAVVATHSSVVAQELPARNVVVLRRLGNVLSARPPKTQTYGGNLAVIDDQIFGMANVTADFEEVMSSAGATGRWRALEQRFELGLSEQALMIALSAEQRQRRGDA